MEYSLFKIVDTPSENHCTIFLWKLRHFANISRAMIAYVLKCRFLYFKNFICTWGNTTRVTWLFTTSVFFTKVSSFFLDRVEYVATLSKSYAHANLPPAHSPLCFVSWYNLQNNERNGFDNLVLWQGAQKSTRFTLVSHKARISGHRV